MRNLAIVSLLIFFSCTKRVETLNPSSFERPNILWLVVEDMGPYLPAFGDSTVSTPTIDKLAATGVRYTNVYSPSGVCAPSRAAIATGMYPSGIGANHMRTISHTEYTGLPKYEAVPPPEVKMLSEILRAAGYYCTNNAKTDYQFQAPITSWDENGKEAHWQNRTNDLQPFFSVFNFGVTHESGLFEPYTRPEIVSKASDFPIPPYLPDNQVVRNDLWKMYNNIAHMDRQVGQVLDQLERDSLLDNTIIFFYSDHGGPLPRQKRMIYDAGLRVPLIIKYPGNVNMGQIDDQLISFVDFTPTVLEMAGITGLDHFDGQSFFDNANQRQYIHAASDRFDEFTDAIRAVRDDRFKLIRNYRPTQPYYLPVSYREQIPTMKELLRLNKSGGLNEIQSQWFRANKPRIELFDCVNDPHELTNLAENELFFEKRQELEGELDRWLREIDDQPNLPERDLISLLWDGQDSQPVTAIPEISVYDQKIRVSCETQGASIGYRIIDGSADHKNIWNIYDQPFLLKEGVMIEVQAHRIGYLPSKAVVFDQKALVSTQ